MRIKPVNIAVPYEDIVSYECNYPGKFVKVLVGTGTLNESGEFIPDANQNYEPIIIDFLNYEELMAGTESKPANVFRKEDLWLYVDKDRFKKEEEYSKAITLENIPILKSSKKSSKI